MAGSNRYVRDLPPAFVCHNSADSDWLSALPNVIARAGTQWALTIDRAFPHIEINYVAPATRADGTRCVLKVSRHVSETKNEIAALQLWGGRGAARLLEADPESGTLLIEHLEPGTMLDSISESDDDAATMIATGVLRQLWRPVPESSGLRSLDSWCDAYDRNREALAQGTGGFPAALFRRADAMRRDLLASTRTPTILHGDLHHFNILRAHRSTWLAIDPKGLAGDRCFDVCQFLRNPRRMPTAVNRRRLDIFCSELGLDRARAKAWCFVHGMLDACWDYEDGNSWQQSVAYAEETLTY